MQPDVGNTWWRTCNLAVERPELPLAIARLLRLDIPDVVALGLRLLTVLVEAEDVLLPPEVVPDLARAMSTVKGARACIRTFFMGIFSSGNPFRAS